MPKIAFMDASAVIIICEHIPKMGKWEDNERLAEELGQNYCSSCGFRRDADLKAQQRVMQSNGKENFQISCFSKDKEPFVLK